MSSYPLVRNPQEVMFGNCCGKSPVVEEAGRYSPGLRVDTSLAPPDFSDDGEAGGMMEPPVTPVGRDELALRRHRFFNDLMAASQSTHRVRFDPRGPSFSGKVYQ